MPTSSITHNFVINNADSAEKFIRALDMPPISKSNLNIEYISDTEKARLLAKRWRENE